MQAVPETKHSPPPLHDPQAPQLGPLHEGSGGGGAQPDGPHASQQLGNCPTHAVPPFGAAQAVPLFLIAHVVHPAALVRQQVTKPCLPQMERAAHFFTNPAQLLFERAAFAGCAAQLT